MYYRLTSFMLDILNTKLISSEYLLFHYAPPAGNKTLCVTS